jgi:OPA family glycerol-3-phosphate transporter-like MFS transporter 1/2
MSTPTSTPTPTSPNWCCAPKALAGAFQSVGWPCVVSIVANWWGKGRRGLVMGLWVSHMPIGNIVGALAAAGALRHGWGWAFAGPGIALSAAGLVMYLLLVAEPRDVGLWAPAEDGSGGSGPSYSALGLAVEDEEVGRGGVSMNGFMGPA